jgi:hypothetical protein
MFINNVYGSSFVSGGGGGVGGGVYEFDFFGPTRTLLAALPLIPHSGQ